MKDYYALTKSGLILGTLITVVAGFLLGSSGSINVWLLGATLVGMFSSSLPAAYSIIILIGISIG